MVGLVGANVPTALQGDPGRLRQIFMNLISNAIKFTAKGEIVVKISSVRNPGTGHHPGGNSGYR